MFEICILQKLNRSNTSKKGKLIMNVTFHLFKIPLLLILGCFLTISGCSSDSPVNPPNPTDSTITVSGKVINSFGSGVVSATISIGDSIKTTDANGNFSISGVKKPYDAKIIASGNRGYVYKGLTSTSPQLFANGAVVTPNSAILNVTIPAVPAGQRATIIYTDQVHVQANTNVAPAGTTGTVNVLWSGSANLTGKIIVIYYTRNAAGNITGYEKYGEKSGFVLNNGGTGGATFVAADLTLNPGESNISGAQTAPAGFTSFDNSFGLIYTSPTTPTSYSTNKEVDFVTTAAFNFVVPTGLPTTPQFVISGRNGIAAGGSVQKIIIPTGTLPLSGQNITFETAPGLTTPPNAATGIDTNTNFTFTTGSGTGIYEVTFLTAGKTFVVYTTSTNTNIPNLNPFGLGIGAAANYTWNVKRYNGITSTDAFVTTPLDFNSTYSSFARSDNRTFTTIP